MINIVQTNGFKFILGCLNIIQNLGNDGVIGTNK